MKDTLFGERDSWDIDYLNLFLGSLGKTQVYLYRIEMTQLGVSLFPHGMTFFSLSTTIHTVIDC